MDVFWHQIYLLRHRLIQFYKFCPTAGYNPTLNYASGFRLVDHRDKVDYFFRGLTGPIDIHPPVALFLHIFITPGTTRFKKDYAKIAR
jgi:hypothetical protein